MAVKKKLYRSLDKRIIAGVFGGLGDYFAIDPSLLRLAYLLFTIATGIVPAIVVYIIAALIVPIKTRKR